MQLLDDTTFSEVINNGQLVVVDFYAEWCPPCRLLATTLEFLASRNPQAHFAKINIDENPKISQEYKISAVPTVIFFKYGYPIQTLVGLQNEHVLNEVINANT